VIVGVSLYSGEWFPLNVGLFYQSALASMSVDCQAVGSTMVKRDWSELDHVLSIIMSCHTRAHVTVK